jgi:hypothetical protein
MEGAKDFREPLQVAVVRRSAALCRAERTGSDGGKDQNEKNSLQHRSQKLDSATYGVTVRR